MGLTGGSRVGQKKNHATCVFCVVLVVAVFAFLFLNLLIGNLRVFVGFLIFCPEDLRRSWGKIAVLGVYCQKMIGKIELGFLLFAKKGQVWNFQF